MFNRKRPKKRRGFIKHFGKEGKVAFKVGKKIISRRCWRYWVKLWQNTKYGDVALPIMDEIMRLGDKYYDGDEYLVLEQEEKFLTLRLWKEEQDGAVMKALWRRRLW